jgi:AcrR family transcriptional regulator
METGMLKTVESLTLDGPGASASMSFRTQQKQQREKTSQSLIEAALELSAAQGYASLSLRSVARKAGIAPTSFYRHFREIDELGLAIVDQASNVLKKSLKQACEDMEKAAQDILAKESSLTPAGLRKIIEPFVQDFLACMGENAPLLRLFFQERTGSAEVLRNTIALKMERLLKMLADTLKQVGRAAKTPWDERRLLAESVLLLVSQGGMKLLTDPDHETDEIVDDVCTAVIWLLTGAAIQIQ